jgi:predicted PurR-regulated permease PerM
MPTRLRSLPAPAVAGALSLSFIALCLLVYILHVSSAIMVPFVIALFVWYLINALARVLARQRVMRRQVPRFACFAIAILFLLSVTLFVTTLLSQNIAQIMKTAPDYQNKLEQILPPLVGIFGLDHVPTVKELLSYIDIEGVMTTLARTFTGIAGKTMVVVFYVGFLLYEQQFFDRKIRAMFTDVETEERVRGVILEIDYKIQRYIGVKASVSALDSFLTFIILSVAGVAFADFWGLMAFFLHFIPYAGSLIAISVPSLIALIQFPDITHAVAVAGVLCLSHAFIGHVLDPFMMGSNLNLSPIFIISSLAMWGMIWGVPGMFLAIPILAAIVITLAQFERTRPIAILMSKTGRIGGPRKNGLRK